MAAILNISIVTYNSNIDVLRQTIESLNVSCQQAEKNGLVGRYCLHILDNSENTIFFNTLKEFIAGLKNNYTNINLTASQSNLGYGRAHNQVIHNMPGDYHLVLNPDVIMDENTISQSIIYLHRNSDVGLIAPFVENEKGEINYLCKRYPSILVLLLRGFFSSIKIPFFRKKIDHYEKRDKCNENKDVLISSGCFMFFRTEQLQRLGGFSDKFFVYFEDFDLTYRFSAMSKIAYVPSVKIIHHGGNAAGKGLKHIFLFSISAIKFFNRFGWRLY